MALPIEAILPALREALATGPGAVLQAEPGAGKTTRVPLALLDVPWLGDGRIVMLEPRRLAARAAARRMAAILGEAVGETVGYRVRLDSRVGPRTRIEVVTEGILTRMLQADPALEGVGLVIFDEFHERSLHADLGLALALESRQALRDDLRLLVMSATLDGDAVAALMGDVPQLRCPGRQHPVRIEYRPPRRGRHGPGDPVEAAAPAVVEALAREPGSVLVFLPGAREIEHVARALDGRLPDDVVLCPLHGNLPQQAQERAIAPAPGGCRKVVLATNIAETSLTIEGIRIVIDTGLERVPRFDPRSAMTRLETATISRASADQRAGRAGRLEPGLCIRLWPEGRHLLPHAAPEIAVADLAPLALELARWGCRDATELAWLDPPPAAALEQARALLERLGAIDGEGAVTAHGERLARLPLHPRLAHMVVTGEALGHGALACDLAALLSERDPLRGGEAGADLRARLELLAQQRRGVAARLRESAAALRRQLRIGEGAPADPDMAGVLVAFAYPDRIARRRPGPEPRYQLSGGRGAALQPGQRLDDAPWLAVAHLEGGDQREGRIALAAPLDEAALERHFGAAMAWRRRVGWDEREEAVVAREERRLGALVFEQRPIEPAPEEARAAMIEGIHRMGLEALPWQPRQRQWRARVALLHRLDPGRWPDTSDAALLESLEQWLGPFLDGVTRRAHLARVDLDAALAHLLGWERQRLLDELAPTHLTVPSGSRIALDYRHDPPVLAVRLQEMFGATSTPAIAGGRVEVVLHLLSPAGRPLQVTRDLAAFWRGSYHEVKKEMRGRYPRHPWPDDPLAAEPTRRAKPRR